MNNYNYDKYLPDCLDSLVRQSVKFDVIYVVDDGSTDRSRAIISEYAESFREIVPLFKDNQGQLSCFNLVCEYITEEDFVWCIDSDDYYPPDYVERFLIEMRNSKSDFFFCKGIKFSTDDMVPRTSCLKVTPNVDIGLSVQITRLTKCWMGSLTSGMALSGRLFKDILPYPFENQWKTRADDILVFASSLGGYSKTYLSSLGIGYRIHGENNFHDQTFNREYKKNRIMNLNTLFSWYSNKYGLGEKLEFASILEEYNSISSRKYCKTINVSLHRLIKKYLIRKIMGFGRMLMFS